MTFLEALTSALLHSSWQLALIALFFAGARASIAPHHANARYAAGCAALFAQLIAPAFTFAWQLREPIAGAASFAHGPTGAHALAAWLPIAWAIGVQLMLARVALGLYRLEKLEREATALDDHWRDRFEAIAAKLELTRRIRWLASANVTVPMTAGVLRPVVLLPIWTLTGIPASALELIVAHELAHIRRFDYAVNLLQSVVEALYFFHPATWWVSKTLRDEREHCCDDLVVARFPDPLAYARALTSLEESRNPASELALASSGGSFMARIQRLFERDAKRRTHPLSAALAAFALLLALTFAGGALAQHLASKAITIPWLPPSVAQHRALIENAAKKHGVDANLLAIVVLVESGGNDHAQSPSGARGLMQVMPKTAALIAKERRLDYTEDELDDPAFNLDFGAYYLAKQLSIFGGAREESIEAGIAAYNGGPEQVRAWLNGQRPLSEETEHYRDLVSRLYSDDAAAYNEWRAPLRESSAKKAINPVAGAKVSFEYGPQNHPFTHDPYVHPGIDLAAATGVPIESPLDGVVQEVSADPTRGKGIVVRHRGGIETRYYHLESVAVRADQKIAQGEVLGTVGSSGKSTGPHLHFEVRDLGEVIDPRPFIH